MTDLEQRADTEARHAHRELVERLRLATVHGTMTKSLIETKTITEAADRIERLEAESARWRDLPWRHKDIQRGLILFRTSNNAHGFTNYSLLVGKVDKLPQAARDELAAIMVNIALDLSSDEVFKNRVIAAALAGEDT